MKFFLLYYFIPAPVVGSFLLLHLILTLDFLFRSSSLLLPCLLSVLTTFKFASVLLPYFMPLLFACFKYLTLLLYCSISALAAVESAAFLFFFFMPALTNSYSSWLTFLLLRFVFGSAHMNGSSLKIFLQSFSNSAWSAD